MKTDRDHENKSEKNTGDRSVSYKKDIIFIGIFILVGLFLAAVVFLTKQTGKSVTVSVSGKDVISFNLDEDREYMIEGKDGGQNLLIIRGGKAWIEEANCRDGLCINMGKIDSVGQSVICLPNEVVVSIGSGEVTDEGPDIVVY
ncbi:MAG: NusG domain II-containing protein [Acetatifactor sp.]|nr:NusG domain II-containing protein [Acetatifactor sp.]